MTNPEADLKGGRAGERQNAGAKKKCSSDQPRVLRTEECRESQEATFSLRLGEADPE